MILDIIFLEGTEAWHDLLGVSSKEMTLFKTFK